MNGESFKTHIYSRSLGRGINTRLSYPHKDITSEGYCRRHQWCGLGFRHDDRVIFSNVLVILLSGDMGHQ